MLSLQSKTALKETIKEFLRYVWFGLVGLVVAYLQAKLLNTKDVTSVTIIVGFVVKFLDSYIHKNEAIPIHGLAPNFLQR